MKEGERGNGLCEQPEHVVTVCGCSDGDGADESTEGQLSGEANKRTHQRADWSVCGPQTGPTEFFGWTLGPASDVPLVHDRALDEGSCSVSSGWRFMLNKPRMLWILALANCSS